MSRFPSFLWLLLLVAFACDHPSRQAELPPGNRYARGFSLEESDSCIRVTVTNPWGQARNVEMEYFLVPKGQALPAHLHGKTVIRTPVERMICMSTSHIAFLEALGETGRISGVSGSQYISSPALQQRLTEGKTTDVGYGQNLNYEEIIRQQPGVVMVYGVDSEIAGFLGKFRDLGIPAVVNAEYLEATPLGKAEWIRFMAAFVGRGAKADSLFRKTEAHYRSLADKVAGVSDKPGVLTGLPYRDTWWIPGGHSYMARLISDAGGQLVAPENSSRESITISMEEAVTLSARASVWINTGNVSSRAEMAAADPRLQKLPAFSGARIFNNNKRATPGGGNDFWESGTVFPDLVLEDLIRVLHPGVLPEQPFNYYVEIR